VVVKHEAALSASTERAAEPFKPLPRGRHGLPREAVTRSQRRRIIDSMIAAAAERGFAETRVVDVVERAGVSRATFYDLFEDLQDCFLAAYDHVASRLLETATTAFERSPDATWPERIRAAVAAELELLVSWPEAARFALVEVLGAGQDALARRHSVLRRFAELVDVGRGQSPLNPPGLTSVAVVGGVQEVLAGEVIHGATASLPARLPDLVYWITQPFVGSEAAAAERDRARQVLRESH
jgi:AcrR family transcriptional regulator